MNDAGDIDHVASAIFSVSKSYPSAGDMPATSEAEKRGIFVGTDVLKPDVKYNYQSNSMLDNGLISQTRNSVMAGIPNA